MVVLILLLYLLSESQGLVRTYSSSQVLDATSGFSLHWNIQGNQIQFGVQATTAGWIAIGISADGEMVDADIVMAYVKNGQSFINDYWAAGRFTPAIDTIQSITQVDVSETGGVTSMEFDRLLNTGDAAQDIVINPLNNINFIWALNNNDPVAPNNFAKHTRKGTQSILLNQNMGGKESVSLFSYNYVVPGSPINLVISEISSTQAKISWNAPQSNGGSEIKGYILQIDDGAAGSFNSIYNGTQLTTTVTGLLPFATYRIKVSAYNNLGSGNFTENSFSTTAEAPGRPEPPVIVASTTHSIELEWQAPVSTGGLPITSYTLIMNGAPIYVGGATSFNVTGLEPDASYDFQVAAANDQGTGNFSTIVHISTNSLNSGPPNAPSAPRIVAISANSVSLQWEIPNGNGATITSFVVQSNQTGVMRDSLWVLNNNITIAGLQENTWYQFRVAAINSMGTGPFSSEIIVVTDPGAPPTPSLFHQESSSNSIRISWNFTTGEDSNFGYIVEMGEGYSPFRVVYNGTLREFSVTELSLGVYRFRVAAYSGRVIGNFSRNYFFTTDGYFAPMVTEGEFPYKVLLLEGRYTLHWKITEISSIIIAIEVNTTGWIGFGLGTSMNNADMIIGAANDTSVTVGDYFSHSETSIPQLDSHNNIMRYTGQEVNGITTIKFERLLNTGDSQQDREFSTLETNIIFSFHRNLDQLRLNSPHTPSDRGTTSISFISGSSSCPRSCSSHGICQTDNKCQCDNGYSGDDCSIAVICSSDADCSGNGKCENGICLCNAGFTGTLCLQEVSLQLSSSLNPEEYSHSVTALDLEIYWKIQDDIIEIAMQAPITGWIGFGIGESMKDADIIMSFVSDTGSLFVGDFNSHGEVAPSQDSLTGGNDDILAFAGSEVNGMTTVKFQRRLDTNDINDKAIKQGPVSVIVAYNPSSDDLKEYHGNTRAKLEINFFTGIAEVTSNDSLIISHGILMTFGWAFCICIGMFIARFGKHLGHIWFIVHVTLNTIGVICVLVGFIIAIVMSQQDFKQSQKVVLAHAWIGLFTVIGAVFQVLLGVIADRLWESSRVKVPIFPDKIHWWLGRLAIITSIITIFLGFASYGVSIAFYIVFGLWIAALIATLLIFQKKGIQEHKLPKKDVN